MRYTSFYDMGGNLRVAVANIGDDTLLDVTDRLPALPGSPMKRLIQHLSSGGSVRDLQRGAPIIRRPERLAPAIPDPTKIVAAPVNYRNHQSEMNEASHIDALGVFLKAPSSLVGHQAVVQLPYNDRRFDQEGEFAAVIGKRTRNVSEADALDAVFGFTSLLDMTMRGGEDRSVRKSFDTFTPVGPSITATESTGPVDDMELHLWVNGTLRQRADVRDLIWSLPRLIAYASSVMTLEPGDIVTTGTPEGVGEIFNGDRIELKITGLERLEVEVSAAGAVACPTRGADRGPKPPTGLTPVAERNR